MIALPELTPCGYCFSAWADTWDHIIPVSHGGRSTPENLMPACKSCNSFLNDKVFDSIEEKREYVRKYKKHFDLSAVQDRISPASSVAKILLPIMPMEKLGSKPPKDKPVTRRKPIKQEGLKFCGTPYERETLITFDAKSDLAHIWTASNIIYKRLLKRLGAPTKIGSRHAEYIIPKCLVRLPKKPIPRSDRPLPTSCYSRHNK